MTMQIAEPAFISTQQTSWPRGGERKGALKGQRAPFKVLFESASSSPTRTSNCLLFSSFFFSFSFWNLDAQEPEMSERVDSRADISIALHTQFELRASSASRPNFACCCSEKVCKLWTSSLVQAWGAARKSNTAQHSVIWELLVLQ